MLLLVNGSQHLQPTVQIPIHFKVKLEVQEPCNGNYLYDWRNYGYSLSGYSPASLSGSHGTITLLVVQSIMPMLDFNGMLNFMQRLIGCYGSAREVHLTLLQLFK